jgi:hypothetical protein
MLPWKKKNELATRSDVGIVGVGPFVHPVDPPLAPRPEWQAARDAVNKAIAEMDQKGALDAGNGDVLDAWLDRLAPQWHAHLVMTAADAEATAQLAAAEYEAAAVLHRRRLEAAAAERDRTQRLLDLQERELLAAHEQAGTDHPDRRRRRRPTLDSLEGLNHQWSWRIVSTVLLALAATGDLISFWITLQAAFVNADAVKVFFLTLAVTAAAVGLMHVLGRTSRNLREGQGGLGRVASVVMLVSWLALGATAFYIRLRINPDAVPAVQAGFGATSGPGAAAGSDNLLSALLLGALFIGSGVLAFWIGFSDHRPRIAAFRSLLRQLREQQKMVARAEQQAIDAEGRHRAALAEIERTRQRSEAARESVQAEIAELKELARLHIAGLLGQPAATNNLTTGRSELAAPSLGVIPQQGRAAAGRDAQRIAQEFGVPAPATNGNGHRGH